MTERYKLEADLTMAERYITEAKKCLFDHYEDYADVQRVMVDLEAVRMAAETLVSKFHNNTLK